jgi:hypothetical protein
MNLKFEHDFQQKIMVQSFAEPCTIDTPKAVQAWRSAWMQELKSWHSPYKLIVDCSKLTYVSTPDVDEAMSRMIKFFEGLFLRSGTGYGLDVAKGHEKLPFKMVLTFEEAQREAGARGMRDPKAPADFRESIQFQNHFAQHVVEMSFSESVVIDSKEKILAIKSKLTNNLMQWHSKWSLLIDCSNMQFDPAHKELWAQIDAFLRGFFMKAVLGYSPNDPDRSNYPFETFRARHAAVARLESEGLFMGNAAHCRSNTKA